MTRANGGVSCRERRPTGTQAIQLAADSFACNVLPTIQTLTAAGFVSQRALANELNRRGIPTARGGSWHYMTVRRVLFRLGLVTSGGTSKPAADARAEALEPTIRKLQKAGLSARAIALELNVQQVPTALGAKWHTTSVSRLLRRLERLAQRTGVSPASDAESK